MQGALKHFDRSDDEKNAKLDELNRRKDGPTDQRTDVFFSFATVSDGPKLSYNPSGGRIKPTR